MIDPIGVVMAFGVTGGKWTAHGNPYVLFSGRSAAVARVLWEHQAGSSTLSARTIYSGAPSELLPMEF